jgi:hypothetical protein
MSILENVTIGSLVARKRYLVEVKSSKSILETMKLMEIENGKTWKTENVFD